MIAHFHTSIKKKQSGRVILVLWEQTDVSDNCCSLLAPIFPSITYLLLSIWIKLSEFLFINSSHVFSVLKFNLLFYVVSKHIFGKWDCIYLQYNISYFHSGGITDFSDFHCKKSLKIPKG